MDLTYGLVSEYSQAGTKRSRSNSVCSAAPSSKRSRYADSTTDSMEESRTVPDDAVEALATTTTCEQQNIVESADKGTTEALTAENFENTEAVLDQSDEGRTGVEEVSENNDQCKDGVEKELQNNAATTEPVDNASEDSVSIDSAVQNEQELTGGGVELPQREDELSTDSDHGAVVLKYMLHIG
jgi:hypothetical protein